MKGSTLTVVDSDLGHFETDTHMKVTRHHINQFGGRETINVEIPSHESVDGKSIFAQFYKMETKDVWKEIVVGRDSDTILVKQA